MDPPGVRFRLAAAGDVRAAAQIAAAALADLRVGQKGEPDTCPGEALVPVFAHLVRHDGPRFWLAEHEDRVVGCGAGLERGTLWFLAALFVLPEFQGLGVGRGLLERAMEGRPRAGGVAAVLSSASNPVSNGLYARRSMCPLMPAINLAGRLPGDLRRPAMAGLDVAPLSAGDMEALRAVDAGVVGFDRTVDHSWLLSEARRRGWLFRRQDRPAGYAYVGGDGTGDAGAVGPVAALRARDSETIVRFVLAELAGQGATGACLYVPGANLRVQRLLWAAGFGFEGSAGLLGASRPFGRFDRYVFAGDALM